MIAGFHTAGLWLHDPIASIVELAHLGFGAVAIRGTRRRFTPTRSALEPKHCGWPMWSSEPACGW